MMEKGNPVFDITYEKMSGLERYPILGCFLEPHDINSIISKFKGLLLTADCFLKAKIAYQYITDNRIFDENCKPQIVMGSVFITWMDNQKNVTRYGFDYNPPLEGHVWIQFMGNKVIDLSLPGVIIRGKKFKDDIGYFLQDLTPFILCGDVPPFIEYNTLKG